MSRFVEVPASRLVETLESIGRKVQTQGGSYRWETQGNERVFELLTPTQSCIRIYTTLALDNLYARDCGKDAVRVVVGVYTNVHGELRRFRSAREPVKLLRTAPRAEQDRVAAFLDRLVVAMREAYTHALNIPRCNKCGEVMAVRDGRHGKFLGCLAYPNCNNTAQIS